MCGLLAAWLVLVAPAALPAGVYKWVDEQGRTHYSDRAPQGEAGQQLRVRPEPPKAATEEAQRRLQDLEDYNRRRQKSLDQEAEPKDRQDQAQAEQQRDRLCQKLKGELAVLGMQAPVFYTEGGQVVYLGDEERALRIARLKEQIGDHCE